MTNNPMTDADERLLSTFATFEREHGRAPTYQELADLCGYSDKTGARYAQQRLEGMGLIRPRQRAELTEEGKRIARKLAKNSR